eukprot:c28508_g1_i2 orf=401-2488(-)
MLPYVNPLIYVVVSLLTGFTVTKFCLPTWILRGLQLYLCPDRWGERSLQGSEGGKEPERTRGMEAGCVVNACDSNEAAVIRSAGMNASNLEHQRELNIEQKSPEGHLSFDGVDDENPGRFSRDPLAKDVSVDGHNIPKGEKVHLQQVPAPSIKARAEGKSRNFSKFAKKKRKDGDKESFDSDQGSSQLLRFSLSDSQLRGKQHFQEYNEATIFSAFGIASLITRELLISISAPDTLKSSGGFRFFGSNDLIPIIMASFAVFKISRLSGKVSWDRNSLQRIEMLWSCSVGVGGFLGALAVLNLFSTTFIDFEFGKTPNMPTQLEGSLEQKILPVSRLMIAVVAGLLSGILVGPARKGVRVFWLGTDQLDWNISVIKWGSVIHILLYLNVLMPLLTSMLWIKPMSEIFIYEDRPQVSANSRNFIGCTYLPEWPIHVRASKDLSSQHHGASDCPRFVGSNSDGHFKQSLKEYCLQDGEKVPGFENCGPEDGISGLERNGNKVYDPRKAAIYQSGVAVECNQFSCENEVKEEVSVFLWPKFSFSGPSENWVQDVGMPKRTFEQFRLWSLLLTGVLQLCLLRVNLQTHLNASVLIWYESLHCSSVINFELTRAKLIVNNYFLCQSALQFLVPGMLIVLFIGLSRALETQSSGLSIAGVSFLSASFIQVAVLFMAWWIAVMWTALTFTILAFYRLGFLACN